MSESFESLSGHVPAESGRKGLQVENGKKVKIIDDYRVTTERLGRGSYGTVWKGYKPREAEADLPTAVKYVKLTDLKPGVQERIRGESQILLQLRHNNVVRLYGTMGTTKSLVLFLEYCAGGDLKRYIAAARKPDGTCLAEATAQRLMAQLVAGVRFLHSRNLVHRDLKPANLLLSSSDIATATLKIADFGLARYFDETELLLRSHVGSPMYMAPEIMRGEGPYTANVDLWSCGVVLYEMLFGGFPWTVTSRAQLLPAIERGLAVPQDWGRLSSACARLLRDLLQVDPDKRLPFAEFFSHEFVTNVPLPPAPAPAQASGSRGRASATEHGGGRVVHCPAKRPPVAPKRKASVATQTCAVLQCPMSQCRPAPAPASAEAQAARRSSAPGGAAVWAAARSRRPDPAPAAPCSPEPGRGMLAQDLADCAWTVAEIGYHMYDAQQYPETFALFEESLRMMTKALKMATQQLVPSALATLKATVKERFQGVWAHAQLLVPYLTGLPQQQRPCVEEVLIRYLRCSFQGDVGGKVAGSPGGLSWR